jgi:hypothetical protein
MIEEVESLHVFGMTSRCHTKFWIDQHRPIAIALSSCARLLATRFPSLGII